MDAAKARRPGLPQADHLANSVDQQREQHQGDDEVFDATAAALLFELTIEIQVKSTANIWKIPPSGDAGSKLCLAGA